ncbi:glycosyltransferase family 4 protein [Methanocella conradii]|uniref:glycosyltransferase family 4 protein n=1 Tax=Methanocella conradii TaxID=1175444 RepID=UPI00157BDEA9|nr:glycosyltransferase family 4 protein [Methanocella conradii]
METLNICIGTYRLAKGNGIDVSVYQFARELAKRHNVTIAVMHSDMDLHEIDVLKYRIGFGDGILGAAKDLDKHHFDLISTHYSPFDLIASRTRIPHYLHDPGVPPFKKLRWIREKRFWAIVNTTRLLSAGKAQCVLPISDYLGREFKRKYCYGGRMKVLPYGIQFPVQEPSGEAAYKKYVLYVGRHTRYKGVHTLFEIFREVKKEVGDVHLVTIGTQEAGYKERLEALASEIGDVHMLGYVPEVWNYYKHASVYATCSEWEGQDRPVIEAQYMGKPVVAFNNCSHPEVVFHGMLANDRKEFKDALIKYLKEDNTDMSVRKKVEEKFSIEGMADKFIDIVKGATDGP